ncbi:hypothetical protein [Tengunoibacter tsumagoiensis]|uniref:Asl1-like glycosyl hydrolase catalytic domain-containing protein n=1 Tax=Tengunoibacter tsumagoiensis TaxID=2014871 RepID=A0A402A0Q6_9CHLR|nr:hypothetical protein [Tengunoibacter tsumagoiensis]GCE12642.1 hypothetical protein KTT_25010 [Tengunoibacter tsumagoiensis]
MIGAVEGSSGFKLADLQDLGINTYRIYGGMSRWMIFDQHSSIPSIEQVQTNPAVIDWSKWDAVMSSPPEGSDYWWVPGTHRWQGNARTLFGSLQSARILPVLVLRNRDDNNNPSWTPDPPQTEADWKLWWDYTFSLVYWLNVRNSYNVNDFEIHNEPDNPAQGWHGTHSDYLTFAWYTANAIDYVYKTFLPGRSYHLYGPVTASGSQWPRDLATPSPFDQVDIHDYTISSNQYIRQVHQWMNLSRYATTPLWLTEWGSYTTPTPYSTVPFGILLLNRLISGSQPGDDYIYGSHLFSLYDFNTQPLGLIDYMGKRRADYYALRMGIRALQGCRPTYQSHTDRPDLHAITTKDTQGHIFVLLTNQSPSQSYSVTIDLSQLCTQAPGTLWQFSAHALDTIIGHPKLQNGIVHLQLPAQSASLLRVV